MATEDIIELVISDKKDVDAGNHETKQQMTINLTNARSPQVNSISTEGIPKLKSLHKAVLFPHQKEDHFESVESLLDFDLSKGGEGFKRLNINIYIAWYQYLTRFAACNLTCKCNTCCCRSTSINGWETCNLCQLILSLIIFPISLIIYVIFVITWILQASSSLFCHVAPCCRNRESTTLRIIDNCHLTNFNDPKKEFDFILHRIPTYFTSLAITIPMYFVRWITGGFKYLPLLPDNALFVALTITPIARAINIEFDDDHRQQIKSISLVLNPDNAPLPHATQISLYPNHYLSVRCAEFNFKTGDIFIQVVNEHGETTKIYRPKYASNTRTSVTSSSSDNDDEQLRKWELAKAHLQSVLTWYIPSWTHNWVHFHFLDIAAKWTDYVVTKNSVLGTLLSAHLRYTSEINIGGTAKGFFNPQGEWDCCTSVTPWKVQPLSQEQFAFKVAQNAAHHYLNKNESGLPTNIRTDAFPPNWVKVRINPETKDQYRGIMPYLDLCSDYYLVIKRFISNLWLDEISMGNLKASLLEKDMTHQWIQQLEISGMPGLSQIDEVTILTTMIWTACIVHSGDHISYQSIFTHWGMYTSVIPWDDNGHWADVLQGNFMSTQWKAFKTKSFMNAFVAHRKSWLWPNDLLIDKGLYKYWNNVPHRNKRDKLREIHEQFRAELKDMNKKWKWLLNLNDFSASTSF